MKPGAFILTILLLFFTAQPLLLRCQMIAELKPAKNCCGRSCGKKQEEKPAGRDCNRTDACNPFAGCGQCQYTVASKYFYSPVVPAVLKPASVSAGGDIETGFQSDCWHPPEPGIA